MNEIVFKIKSGNGKFMFPHKGLGDIDNISNYDDNLFKIELINALSVNLLINNISNEDTLFRGKSIFELKNCNIFKYIGDSRIDGCPIFIINDDTYKIFNRDYLISDLGVNDI